MIGLGGAEFRLPLLIGVFGFVALQAVVMNKAMSLLVVVTALPGRLVSVPWSSLSLYWFVAVNLLAGSLVVPGLGRPGRRGCGRPPCTGCWLCCWS